MGVDMEKGGGSSSGGGIGSSVCARRESTGIVCGIGMRTNLLAPERKEPPFRESYSGEK